MPAVALFKLRVILTFRWVQTDPYLDRPRYPARHGGRRPAVHGDLKEPDDVQPDARPLRYPGPHRVPSRRRKSVPLRRERPDECDGSERIARTETRLSTHRLRESSSTCRSVREGERSAHVAG